MQKEVRRTYEVLPLNPEKNPPESIEELEELIDKLQEKSRSIKQQLEVIALREKQGLEVDYTRVKGAIYARSQTNKSIAVLQLILKKKKLSLSPSSATAFEKFFFSAAKEKLPGDLFSSLIEETYTKLRAAENLAASK